MTGHADILGRLLDEHLPAWGVVRVAEVDREVAMLRTTEAVRLHAGRHGGSPPAALATIDILPVPPGGDPRHARRFVVTVAPMPE